MWHYLGPVDSTLSHPEEVCEETMGQWLRSSTGACDNPVGAKRTFPFSAENQPPNLVSYILVEYFHIFVELLDLQSTDFAVCIL